jgi:NitT/TauT family transport system substrate-binding protein
MLRSLIALSLVLLATCGRRERPRGILRVGHFPNITHAQALIAHHRSRTGTGFFEERVGQGFEWYVYNAGPSAMEALLSGSLDITYVGPNPAINAYVRSGGDEVRVIAGAAEGGSALLVREGSGIESVSDFRGRTVATPQFGNTQDIAARAWLAAQGFAITVSGGDVRVLPTHNPEQLALFQRGQLDAAWTVEPWVSRLEREANARVFVEDPEALTTVLVASARFVAEEPERMQRFVAAHHELTAWMVAHPEEAKTEVRAELEALTRVAVPPDLIDRCWARLRFTADVSPAAFTAFLERAQRAGFLKEAGSLDRLVLQP